MAENIAMEEQPGAARAEGRTERRLPKFWKATIQLEASDLIVRPGVPIKFRLRGILKNADAEPFTEDEMEWEIQQLLTKEQWDHYLKHGSVDIAYAHDEDNRFRVNVFRTMGRSAIAARRISSEILNYEQLNLPPVMGQIAEAQQGLVLLCGVTGSGKSTTIASMLQQINETRPCHILTIEDPIEYMYKDEKAIVNQREIGIDVNNFGEALRAMVRENPDVVLIGELRDRETFQAAVQAAETGHLVFGTVHASSVAQCFSRIYNLFDTDERPLIREMFSSTLQALIYQRLLKTLRKDVPRVPGLEVMINNPTVKKYIREEREIELPKIIRQSQHEGMIDYHQWLVDLVDQEFIHPRVALEAARNQDEMKMRMKGIQTGTG